MDIEVLRTVAFAVFCFAGGGWFATFMHRNKREKEQERHPYRPIAQCVCLDCVYHDLPEAGFDCTACRILIDRECRCKSFQPRTAKEDK